MAEKKSKQSRSVGMVATSGIAWTMVQTLCGKAAVFVGQLILAKILIPEDFGVVGLTYTITMFFGVLSDMGIGQTLQQRHPRTHLWATQAFWLTLLLSSMTAIAMAIYAPIGAKLYHNDKITDLVWILALNMPLASLATVPSVRLQSLLKFNFIAIYGSMELIAIQVLTILFAWTGWGALSFVLPIPLTSLIRTIVYWNVAPVSLKNVRYVKGWTQMIKRSSGILGSSILAIAVNQGDYITLGLVASAQVVGIYYFAFKLSAQPMITLATSFTGVLRPALVNLKNDSRRQRDAAIRTAELLGLLIVPLCFLQIAIAKPALILMFGRRWLESIPLVEILSVGLPFGAISWATSTLLAARGQNAKIFKYQAMMVPFFFIFVGFGALSALSIGVAIGVALYSILSSLLFTILVLSQEGLRLGRILSLYYKPFLMGAASIGGGYLFSSMPMFSNMLLTQIIITTVFGGIAYTLAVRYYFPILYKDLQLKFTYLLPRKFG